MSLVLSLGLGALQAGVLTKVELLLSLILAVSIYGLSVFEKKNGFLSVINEKLERINNHLVREGEGVKQEIVNIQKSTKSIGSRLMYQNFNGYELVFTLNKLFFGFVRNERYTTFTFIRQLSSEIGFFRQSLRLRGFEVSLEVVIWILKHLRHYVRCCEAV